MAQSNEGGGGVFAMADAKASLGMQEEMRRAWFAYLEVVEPARPGLFAYCRKMTRNVWDAEDLVQDSLLRGFGRLGTMHQEIANPTAYLLRIASNLWIDRVRRLATERAALEGVSTPDDAARENVDAAEQGVRILMGHLAPQERAAVVLKDVFEYSAKEIAAILETTEGAVKAALHRGRARLRELPDEPALSRRPPSTALVDRFVDLFNARDTVGLTDLLLENSSVEVLGIGAGLGKDAITQKEGWLDRCLNGHPEWPEGYTAYSAQRAERFLYQDEEVIVLYRTREGSEALEEVWRLEEEEGKVARIRDYCFCPEALREVCEELGLPFWTYETRYPML